LSRRYCYLPLLWKSWNRVECAVGGVRHPQHTQTGSNSSTIAADSSNGVTSTRCCRYSCLRSWWWVEVPPETCRAVSRLNCVTLHLVGYILEYNTRLLQLSLLPLHMRYKFRPVLRPSSGLYVQKPYTKEDTQREWLPWRLCSEWIAVCSEIRTERK